jgi:hypothetical protein
VSLAKGGVFYLILPFDVTPLEVFNQASEKLHPACILSGSRGLYTQWFPRLVYSVVPAACILSGSRGLYTQWFPRLVCSVVPADCILSVFRVL